MIQDGSSFAVKRALQDVFPGRFTTKGPAAVELHATYSGYADDITTIHLAPDCEAERQFLPDPGRLTDCLFLADRDYPSLAYFLAVRAHGGAFIIRLSASHDPYVTAAWQQGRRLALASPIRLSRFLAQHPAVAWISISSIGTPIARSLSRGRGAWASQADESMVYESLRAAFSATLVGRLYRFRWQIELCFKEWKSYANLHKFDTANPHIAAGLIWAGLCAAMFKRFLAHAAQRVGGGAPISTRRVAMCAHLLLTDFVAALVRGRGLRTGVQKAMGYLLANARRSERAAADNNGRLRARLVLVGGA